MQYSTGKRCVFYHRYNIVWSTKYRYKVLQGDIQLRVRAICRQVCREKGGDIVRGVLPQFTSTCLCRSRPSWRWAIWCGWWKNARPTRCNVNSRSWRNAVGGADFGVVGISRAPTVPLPKTSYFSTSNTISPIQPAPADRSFSDLSRTITFKVAVCLG